VGTSVLSSNQILGKIIAAQATSERFLDINAARIYRGNKQANQYVPMILTTDFQVSRGDSGQHLLFWSGPQNTTWSFQQRGVIQQTRTGHIAHYWRDDKRSTFFDDPSVTFTFQTGNIMPLRTLSGTGALTALPPGLLDYYDFFTFLDEPKILSDGRPNFINIVYHSMLYPTILLRGFFEPDSVITVTEDASRPASVSWSATFRIRSSDPPLTSGKQLQSAWLSNTPSASALPVDAPDTWLDNLLDTVSVDPIPLVEGVKYGVDAFKKRDDE
jgi:hypothetical protein